MSSGKWRPFSRPQHVNWSVSIMKRHSLWYITEERTPRHVPEFYLEHQAPICNLYCFISVTSRLLIFTCSFTVYIYILKIKLTFHMLTVRGQQHSFPTHERVLLWKCQSFWDRKCLNLRGLEPQTFGFMLNALTFWAFRARHLLSNVFFNTGSGAIYIIEVKLTFDMLTMRGQQHLILTHERVFLWKCQRFWDRKCFDLRGTWTPNLRIHAECSNILTYKGQTFAVQCFWILALVV